MGNSMSAESPVIEALLPINRSCLDDDQRYITNYMRLTYGTCTAFCYLGYKYLPMTLPAMPSVVERLAFTIQWQLPGIIFMIFPLAAVRAVRFCDLQHETHCKSTSCQRTYRHVACYCRQLNHFCPCLCDICVNAG